MAAMAAEVPAVNEIYGSEFMTPGGRQAGSYPRGRSMSTTTAVAVDNASRESRQPGWQICHLSASTQPQAWGWFWMLLPPASPLATCHVLLLLLLLLGSCSCSTMATMTMSGWINSHLWHLKPPARLPPPPAVPSYTVSLVFPARCCVVLAAFAFSARARLAVESHACGGGMLPPPDEKRKWIRPRQMEGATGG